MTSSQHSHLPYGEELLLEIDQEFSSTSHRLPPQRTHLRTIPASPSQTGHWPSWVLPSLRHTLGAEGIDNLYLHQSLLAESLWEGKDSIISTGTASGKTLGFHLPILSALADPKNRDTVLYLSPTKALSNDQFLRLSQLCSNTPELRSLSIGTYDGDTSPAMRKLLRTSGRILLSNPDMLHYSLLADTDRWSSFLRRLRYLIIDEAHTYRGVFGAHVSMVLKRLQRFCSPIIIIASATTADPRHHAHILTGRSEFALFDQDYSPRGERTYALYRPMETGTTGSSAQLIAAMIQHGARVLSFTSSRRQAETLALATQGSLPDSYSDRIAAYRAGYSPEQRRSIEKNLDNGTLLGVAATNALELGIDVGGLDAVLCAGYPGRITSFYQQAGRAGRRGQGSVVILVAGEDPLDQYMIDHPQALLDSPLEAAVFDPRNPYVLRDHILCAAAEKPLSAEAVENWGAQAVVEELLAERMLRPRRYGLMLTQPDAEYEIRSAVSLRGTGTRTVQIVEQDTGLVLGNTDSERARRDVHDGAVYLHQGESYVVQELHEDIAWVRAETPPWTTHALSEKDISITRVLHSRELRKNIHIAQVEVQVRTQVTGYQRRDHDRIIDVHPLHYPPEYLRTMAVAYTISEEQLSALGIRDIPGALHAAEHAAIGLLPLIATCDRWDIGGLSTAIHPDTGMPTVFVYDGYPGGAGFAEQGYERFSFWMAATAERLKNCLCDQGCPSCIQSPKCGNANHPLHKDGALRLLEYLRN